MGFRKDGILKVWSAEPSKTGKTTKVKASSSRKNKMTGEYEQDFSAYCIFIGQAHQKAVDLKEGDLIRVGENEVCNHYDKEKKTTFVDYKVYDFEKFGDGRPRAVRGTSEGAQIESGPDEDSCPF